MGAVKKLTKKTLGNLNIINQAEPLAAPTVETPLPLPVPQLPIAIPALQPAAEAPTQSAIYAARKEKLAKAVAGIGGRASTILNRRRERSRAAGLEGGAGGDSPAPAYTNSVLGS